MCSRFVRYGGLTWAHVSPKRWANVGRRFLIGSEDGGENFKLIHYPHQLIACKQLSCPVR